mmetsp:Transcript_25233/g.58570  ORF Transcript_25233/g.58570 Transcript_25233/m.58570 type:complete len:235 (-) Transcript_25233:1042-1746(-)
MQICCHQGCSAAWVRRKHRRSLPHLHLSRLPPSCRRQAHLQCLRHPFRRQLSPRRCLPVRHQLPHQLGDQWLLLLFLCRKVHHPQGHLPCRPCHSQLLHRSALLRCCRLPAAPAQEVLVTLQVSHRLHVCRQKALHWGKRVHHLQMFHHPFHLRHPVDRRQSRHPSHQFSHRHIHQRSHHGCHPLSRLRQAQCQLVPNHQLPRSHPCSHPGNHPEELLLAAATMSNHLPLWTLL